MRKLYYRTMRICAGVWAGSIMGPPSAGRGQWLRWLMSLSLFMLCVMMYIAFSNMSLPPVIQMGISDWAPYRTHPLKDKGWFERTCLQGTGPLGLEGIPDVIVDWRHSKHVECRDLYLTFIKLLEVRQEEGSVDLPDPFKVKVRSWLANDNSLFQHIYDQRMVFIRNKYTREENVFNPLRSKRPLPKLEKPERQYIEELSTQTKEGCDFCRYHEYTARDSLGRVEGLHSFTAANTFKLDRWHDLVLLKKHHPINWTQEEFLDLMETLLKWFEKVNQADQNYVYPSAIWDLLPHAGASQVHPHLHSFMDKERYQGFQDQWREAAMRYSGDFPKRNYFSDLIQLHAIMGLTVQYGSAVAFANIVPKKDNEMVIVSERADRDFFLLWYFVLRGFLDDMQNGTMCFSSGAAFPSMTGDTSSQSLPAYVRIITRGIVSDNRADISSLELFTTPNANTDPFHVISVMKESVRKRSPSGKT
ncbi:uncharacterized protein LOC128217076 isoform X1 [Mya arenaria]|uniref:uncharacterized protein LOC128217076 isoform X1 n=2 Tax=Mya arenaria TaxID=6604 RepID=UPI0022E69F3E|nr:uncharacterized protein LOC128217076 isoform X1 [Mya arenaria]